MKNTADSGGSGQMTIDMNMDPQSDIHFRPPPPYSIEQPAFQGFGPNDAFGSIGTNATLSMFDQSLGINEQFILAPIGRFGFRTRTLIVQLQDILLRPLMSIMTIPGQNISTGHRNNSFRLGSIIQMSNTSGQTLLTARENGQSVTVSSGELVLGVIEGSLFCSNTLTVRGVMGQILFQSIGGTEMNAVTSTGCFGATPNEFTLISNGVALARIGRQINNFYGGANGGVISLLNSQNMDLRTKALLIFTGYLMFYAFLADTSFGKIGARGFAKRLFMCYCIFFFIAMVLFISIPIIVITTQ